MRDFKELKVWERAHQLTLKVYRITKNFPSDERFGLTVQLHRGDYLIICFSLAISIIYRMKHIENLTNRSMRQRGC
ncbi:four helix bundle protein [Thermodesulfovibrionales bacterium]|nr:four helix bundle protein [Thermodesulfovibrionales bacterium]MCL0047290.1 four helix bundle protein [Thermodesulfovibrionales bacterium]MCL0067222.1 four helix bundle protein [Thermodesulfovibrionales bacterium]MCL0085598.1 four helix bundle protein [Thermodesulfovibrionales bacterium]MCL0085857.1 four helix bundle protein [Thermodesulfovibrionales bacterium]